MGMTTARLSAAPDRPDVPPREHNVQLFLTIDGFPYQVRAVMADPILARRAYQLIRPDGRRYDVAETVHGSTCDCPDFIFRREGRDPAGCKHVRALVACGLIERSEAEIRALNGENRPIRGVRPLLSDEIGGAGWPPEGRDRRVARAKGNRLEPPVSIVGQPRSRRPGAEVGAPPTGRT